MSRRFPRRSTRPLHLRLFPVFLACLLLITFGLIARDYLLREITPAQHASDAASQRQTSRTVTAGNGSSTITEGAATITLETGAEVRITRQGDKPASDIELRRGSIRVQVRPVPGGRFLVRTFNATVGVRGTTFRVSVVGLFATRVLVEEGKVFVRGQTGEEILLGANESGEVLGGDAAERGTNSDGGAANTDYPSWNEETMRRAAALAEALARTEREAAGFSLPSAGTGSALTPDLTTTSRNRLTGTGDWTADNGLAGQITLVIEPISGSFSGTVVGERSGTKPLNIHGNVRGTLTGDADNGSLDGRFTVEAEPTGSGVALPPLDGEATGTLRNHLVTGTLNAGPWRGHYEVRLQ